MCAVPAGLKKTNNQRKHAWTLQVAAQHDKQTFSLTGQAEGTDGITLLVVHRPSAARWPRRSSPPVAERQPLLTQSWRSGKAGAKPDVRQPQTFNQARLSRESCCRCTTVT